MRTPTDHDPALGPAERMVTGEIRPGREGIRDFTETHVLAVPVPSEDGGH